MKNHPLAGAVNLEDRPRVKARSKYIFVYFPEHPKANFYGLVLEHRVLIEAKIGRLLERDEQVHHINEAKDCNDIDNLQLMSISEHSRLHHSGRDWTDEQIAKSFNARMEKYGSGNNRTQESYKKQWETRRRKYGKDGCKDGKKFCGSSESMRKTWAARKAKYGPSGFKNK